MPRMPWHTYFYKRVCQAYPQNRSWQRKFENFNTKSYPVSVVHVHKSVKKYENWLTSGEVIEKYKG